MHRWELWYPEAAATGLLVARGQLDPTDVLWTHAVPDILSIVVRDTANTVVAQGEHLRRTGDRLPMTRLRRNGDRISREDRWPMDSDLGAMVILPGGEVGMLKAWWHAEDGSAWRWTVEFFNRR